MRVRTVSYMLLWRMGATVCNCIKETLRYGSIISLLKSKQKPLWYNHVRKTEQIICIKQNLCRKAFLRCRNRSGIMQRRHLPSFTTETVRIKLDFKSNWWFVLSIILKACFHRIRLICACFTLPRDNIDYADRWKPFR